MQLWLENGIHNHLKSSKLELTLEFCVVFAICFVLKNKSTLTGWGATRHGGRSSPLLMQARMPIVDPQMCLRKEDFVCAGYKYASDPSGCRGDSGGPLMCPNGDGPNGDDTWAVFGVASFIKDSCKFFNGYSSVSMYMSWIAKHVPDYKQH